jgi:hypothetical protein
MIQVRKIDVNKIPELEKEVKKILKEINKK